MTDPKSISELNIVIDAIKRELSLLVNGVKEELAEFRHAVDRRFNGVIYRIYFVVPFLVAIVVGGFALRKEIGDIDKGLTKVGEQLEALRAGSRTSSEG